MVSGLGSHAADNAFPLSIVPPGMKPDTHLWCILKSKLLEFALYYALAIIHLFLRWKLWLLSVLRVHYVCIFFCPLGACGSEPQQRTQSRTTRNHGGTVEIWRELFPEIVSADIMKLHCMTHQFGAVWRAIRTYLRALLLCDTLKPSPSLNSHPKPKPKLKRKWHPNPKCVLCDAVWKYTQKA